MVSFLHRRIMPWLGALAIAYALFHEVSGHAGSAQVLFAPDVYDLPVAYSRAQLTEVASRGPGPENSFRVAVDTPVTVLSRGPLAAEITLPDGRHGWVFREWLAAK